MQRSRILGLTALAMVAFAGNSVLCRLALSHTSIDAASFTTLRLTAGALVLSGLLALRGHGRPGKGDGLSIVALFGYAAFFSFAYRSLSAATGALILFGAVQVTMIGCGLAAGERLARRQWVGVVLALVGLLVLLLPGLSAPPPGGAFLMLCAGGAWGLYSLRGRGRGDPVRVSAENFVGAAALAVALHLLMFATRIVDLPAALDTHGMGYALASGALASGLGYVVWYAVLPSLAAGSAATVQLSVPVLTALGGIVFLGESLTLRFIAASAGILGGIALVILGGAGNGPDDGSGSGSGDSASASASVSASASAVR